METISLKRILEILSEEIWLLDRPQREIRNPSLLERLEIVEKMLETAEMNDGQITFKGTGANLDELPASNYILLEGVYEIIDEETNDMVITWRITAFDKFNALHDYMHEKDCWRFAVLVKQGDVYKKAEPVFWIRDNKGKRMETDIWGFHLSWGYPMGNCDYEREPYVEHHFDLYGLCEFQYEEGVFCGIVNSLDDLLQFMDEKLFDMLTQNHYREEMLLEGEVHYSDEVYFYKIMIDQEEAGHGLYNKDGDAYCIARHAFVKPSLCDKIEDCQDCIELFGLQTEIDVMEELCENAKLE